MAEQMSSDGGDRTRKPPDAISAERIKRFVARQYPTAAPTAQIRTARRPNSYRIGDDGDASYILTFVIDQLSSMPHLTLEAVRAGDRFVVASPRHPNLYEILLDEDTVEQFRRAEPDRVNGDHHVDISQLAESVLLIRTSGDPVRLPLQIVEQGATNPTESEMILDPRIEAELRALQASMAMAGELLTPLQLKQFYSTFRDRFGPQKLASLDGEPLLSLIHDHSSKDSLVYWLEFKDDEEFPARFGSIAGGSALKFGIYKRKETGNWMTGSSKKQIELSVNEAIEYARRHRDQLLKGVELLEALPVGATDAEYAKLQSDMDAVAPDVSNLAWGHKYFSLLFPDKLDDFHSPDWQRFHLIALLQTPPDSDGRYLSAGRFVALASRFDVPMNNLTTLLGRRRLKRSYWRIGTSDTKERRNQWEPMRSGNRVAIGWPKLGDLSDETYDTESKEHVKQGLSKHYPGDASAIGRKASQILRFVTLVQEGDIVVACDGATVLGIGRVTGDYEYDASLDFPHLRPVEWLNLDEWTLPAQEGLRTTCVELWEAANLIEVERRLLGATPITTDPRPKATAATATRASIRHSMRLTGVPGRIQSVLERKGQVILYGPPGTGKTYWAQRTARDLVAIAIFATDYHSLDERQKLEVSSSTFVQTCCFHPAYGYEDFIEGYRPTATDGQMHFELRDGVFKRLCDDAAKNPDHPFFLIIDEINRGDIPRIFGELLHALEMDKRGSAIVLPVSGQPLAVPRNVHVIGTMNTADRSIALLDTALRRRFGFIELMPDTSLLEQTLVNGIPVGRWLAALNQRICQHVGRDARNLQIGHAYFLDGGKPVTSFSRLSRIIREDIIPLLQDYCYEDYAALEQILGEGLIDKQSQQIKYQLFEDARQQELVQALLAPAAEVLTSAQATVAESAAMVDDEEEEEVDVADGEASDDDVDAAAGNT